MIQPHCFVIAIGMLASIFDVTHGLTLPFTENFDTNSSFWTSTGGGGLLDFVATGGPDGSSYASGPFNYMDIGTEDQGPVIMRANTIAGVGSASGGELFGNWIGDNVTQFSARIRHDAGTPLSFFVRFAGPNNFPGASAVIFAPVPSGVWTPITIPIDPSNPQFIGFPESSFDAVFPNVGRIQIGTSVPEGLAGVNQMVTFDVDQVSIVPEPASATMAGVAAWIGWFLICPRLRRDRFAG